LQIFILIKKNLKITGGGLLGGGAPPPPTKPTTTTRSLYPRERPGTHCIGGWMGPRAGLDGCGKSRPPLRFDRRTVQPVASRYTDWAIPDHVVTVCCYEIGGLHFGSTFAANNVGLLYSVDIWYYVCENILLKLFGCQLTAFCSALL
jgi:hypothetical protein